jgi:hypothetical protein
VLQGITLFKAAINDAKICGLDVHHSSSYYPVGMGHQRFYPTPSASSVNNNLILFFAAIFAVTGILAAFKDSIEPVRMLWERPAKNRTPHRLCF